MAETQGTRLREPQITLDEIKGRVRRTGFVCYGMRSCWWAEHTFYALPKQPGDRLPGLPVDPRGGPLMQVDGRSTFGGERHDPLEFIRMAERNPSHYGRHGMAAFIAAYHGNVLDEHGNPTCLRNWEDYNRLLDGAAPGTGADTAAAVRADGPVSPEGQAPKADGVEPVTPAEGDE